MTDRDYMLRAIGLAKKGEGWVHPNPMVGAVIVKDGRIIGEGYHRKWGELHAERNAIASLTEPAEGATLYVTLEPCCHYGKTPPCTEAIIENKIAKVVVGSRDPNPKVSGGGVAQLRAAGIEVVEDFMREECDALNPVFFYYITHQRPYVVMKYAMTADGKIATTRGESRWITGPEARDEVQKMRHAWMGIMVGIGTVLADNPMLNCRLPGGGGRDPLRIICDSHLRIPEHSKICDTAKEVETLIACAIPGLPEGEITAEMMTPEKDGTDFARDKIREDFWKDSEDVVRKIQFLQDCGIRVLNVADEGTNSVDLDALMEYLGKAGIDSILLEGGGILNDGMLEAGLVQELRVFLAPKIFGGRGRSPVEGQGVDYPAEAYMLKYRGVRQIGDDLMIRYTLS